MLLTRPFDQGAEASRDDMIHEGMTAVGDLVRSSRLNLGLSQRQLAWGVGMSQSTISRLESGTLRGMRLPKLALIIGAVRLDPRFIRSGEPPAPRRRLPGQMPESTVRSAARLRRPAFVLPRVASCDGDRVSPDDRSGHMRKWQR